MVRYMFVVATFVVLLILSSSPSIAQASKKLQEKSAQSAQQKSWEQVDQINKESDATRSRYQQAQGSGVDKKKYTGGNITRSSIFPKTQKKKSAVKKEDATSKKKKKQ